MTETKFTERELYKEIAKRKEVADEKAKGPQWKLEEVCFDKQLEFIQSTDRHKTGVCSRRAGKTWSCAADLIDTVISRDNIEVAYITLSRLNARRLIWRQLLYFNELYNLGGIPDKVHLEIHFPNRSVIYVSGAKDEGDVEKLRGLGLYKVYIDECQSFRPYIKFLIEDVLEPSLMDYNGYLILIGTPGPLCAGVFYDACHDEKAWKHFAWTMIDNPYLEKKSGIPVEELMRRQRERRGITTSDPTYQREYLGRWVYDDSSLVYKYNPELNHYDELPEGKWNYIFGIDIGHDDADAIAVLGFNDKDPNVYLVDELVQDKQDITSLANQIKDLQAIYNPIKMVMDAGALGKKIQLEINTRHGLSIEAAEKKRKLEFIELLNDDLRTSKLKMKEDSICAEDYMLIQWDKNQPVRKVSNIFHSDISDAVLYAWRESKHYAYEPEEAVHHRDSEAYMDQLEAKEAAAMEKKNAQKGNMMLGEYDFDQPLYDMDTKFIGED